MASLSLPLMIQPRDRRVDGERHFVRHDSFTSNSESAADNSPLLHILERKVSLVSRWMGFTVAHFLERNRERAEQTPRLLSNVNDDDPRSASRNLIDWTLNRQYDGGKAVLIDAANPTRSLSRNSAKEMVVSLSGAFDYGSTVCLHLENDIMYPVLTLAILASGCLWTGTNTAYKPAELEHHFRSSDTRYVVTSYEQLDIVNEALEMAGICAEIIVFDDLVASTLDRTSYYPTSIRRLGDLVRPDNQTTFDTLQAQVCGSNLAFLMQTSGTTGQPKLAARTHKALMAELDSIQDNNAEKPYEVRRLFCTPIFHAFSAPEMLFNSLRLGQANYFMKRYDQTFAQKVEEFRITETYGAPPMLLLLAQQTQYHPMLQTLRMVAYGGAHLGAEARQRFLSIFDLKPRLVPVYGMTEGGWFSMLKHPEVCDDGSIGRPIPGVEFHVAASSMMTNHTAGPAVGELMVRGPQVMEGYFANADANVDAFIDGWLRTGDIGYIQHGKVFVVDRVKDLIKMNGWQVGPAELENALLRSSDVTDCAVFGMGRDVAEHPVACIVPSHSGVTAEGVREHLGRCLASYKHSRCEIRFVDVIPKSAAGKILKKVLREQMEQR